MDKIRKFDRAFEKAYEGTFFNGKICTFLLCGLGTMLMMFPVKWNEILSGTAWFGYMGCMLCASGVRYYIRSYMCVREGDRYVSIYKKLEYMPVTRAEIRKARFGYLNHFCIRLAALDFLIQQLASLLNHSFGIGSVLYAAAWTALVWIAGIISIYV